MLTGREAVADRGVNHVSPLARLLEHRFLAAGDQVNVIAGIADEVIGAAGTV
jgi:hypothetical protein